MILTLDLLIYLLIYPKVRNLAVILDSSLKFDKQISAVIRSSFFYLHSIAKIAF